MNLPVITQLIDVVFLMDVTNILGRFLTFPIIPNWNLYFLNSIRMSINVMRVFLCRCVLYGCVPKKLLVYSSKYSHEFDESGGFGWKFETEPKHDWSTLMANKNAELQRLTGIYKNILNNAGVTLIEGRGKVGYLCNCRARLEINIILLEMNSYFILFLNIA